MIVSSEYMFRKICLKFGINEIMVVFLVSVHRQMRCNPRRMLSAAAAAATVSQ